SSGRTESDLRLYDSLSGEDLSDRARRYPLWTAGRSGAGGATPGREHGGEVSSVRPERGGVPGSTENVLTPETGKRAEASPQGCAQLDERFPSPEESSFGSDSAGRDTGWVADVLWRLTSVALRAPPVSRQRTKSGAFYFAKNRTFLLCLDTTNRHHKSTPQIAPQIDAAN